MKKTPGIFRDLRTSGLLLLGYILCYFIVVNAAGIVSNLMEDSGQSGKYENSLDFTMQYDGNAILEYEDGATGFEKDLYDVDIRMLIDDCRVEKGNLELINIYLPVGNAATYQLVNVELSHDDECGYDIKEGRNISESDIREGNQVVVIGQDVDDYTQTIEGKRYLKICNDYYEVIGEFAPLSQGGRDMRIMVNYGSMTEDSKSIFFDIINENFIYHGLDFKIMGDDGISAEFKELAVKISENYAAEFALSSSGSDENQTIDDMFLKLSFVLNIVMYIFCATNCIVITELWIYKRIKEMAIRKTYGYSGLRIFGFIFKNMFGLSVVSLIVSLAAELVYIVAFGSGMVSLSDICYKIPIMFAGVLIVIILTSVQAVVKVETMVPANELKK